MNSVTSRISGAYPIFGDRIGPLAGPVIEASVLADCAAALETCSLVCAACADECTADTESDELARCIRSNLFCSAVTESAGELVARYFEAEHRALCAELEVCIRACATCGAECDRHAAEHAHCGICAEECRRCEVACRLLLARLSRNERDIAMV